MNACASGSTDDQIKFTPENTFCIGVVPLLTLTIGVVPIFITE
jgi:hypothetical protein